MTNNGGFACETEPLGDFALGRRRSPAGDLVCNKVADFALPFGKFIHTVQMDSIPQPTPVNRELFTIGNLDRIVDLPLDGRQKAFRLTFALYCTADTRRRQFRVCAPGKTMPPNVPQRTPHPLERCNLTLN